MSITYDDATIQAAIDEALARNSHASLCTRPWSSQQEWRLQAPARLCLARGLLSRLPGPDAKELCASLKETAELMCKDWADDHTRLQKMCLEAGCTEAEVEGSPDGVPGILELAEFLVKRIGLLETTPPEGRCDWKEDSDGNWDTSCDRCMCFEYAPPFESGYKFCHHCGLPINFIKSTQEEN